MRQVLSIITKAITENYKKTHNLLQLSPDEISTEILDATIDEIELQNATRGKGIKLPSPKYLLNFQIANLLLAREIIAVICMTDEISPIKSREKMELGIYIENGINEGIYSINRDDIKNRIQEFRYDIPEKDIMEVIALIKRAAPVKKRSDNQDLIPVNNGIFNYKTKKLLPFTPDEVFINKLRVNYNPLAVNPVFTNPDNTTWDVESWMMEVAGDDKEIFNLLWQVIGAVIRPYVRWNKSVLFYSQTGNSGKGTLCELMRRLCGTGNYASIPIAKFGERFALASLVEAMAVIVDENDVGIKWEKVSAFKAAITHDIIQLEKKYENPIEFQFHGLIVQCLNEMPEVTDATGSFYRRQLFIPFIRCFTGKERKYIKDIYLKDAKTLEYVLLRVLHMDYYEFSNPEACQELLEDNRNMNNAPALFWNEFRDGFIWNALPIAFLYDLYIAWYKQNFTYITTISKTELREFFKESSKNDPVLMNGWRFTETLNGRNKEATKVYHNMDKYEPLIEEYSLNKWKRQIYRDEIAGLPEDQKNQYKSEFKETYRYALIKNVPAFQVLDADDELSEETGDDSEEGTSCEL